MFRKLVSNLPFSPALVGQLGFYTRRLKKEQATRRLGLIFTALAVAVQSFAVFNPPEQALASNQSDVIPGGVSTEKDVLKVYDLGAKSKNDFKDLLDYYGVTRTELGKLSSKKICSSDKSIISIGRDHVFSTSQGELKHAVPKQSGGYSTFYSRPLYRFDVKTNGKTNCYDMLVGSSKKAGWFAIMKKCGNLAIKKNVKKLPRGSFITATCKTITGFAYDERQLDKAVKIYLYFGGAPGNGTKYGPIVANDKTPGSPVGAGHGFSFAIPEKYQKTKNTTTVWAVLQPLPGWTEATVQFENKVSVPGNCTPASTPTPKPEPTAACSSLRANIIERTKFTYSATGTVSSGATIKGYHYVISKEGKMVFDKTYNTSNSPFTSEVISLKDAGTYEAKVSLLTSIGSKDGAACIKILTVSPPDKCKYNDNLLATDKDCQPCPYDSSIWSKDEDCSFKITQSKEARNLTQGIGDANNTTAKPGDRIEYTLTTSNLGVAPATTNIEEALLDVLDYGSVTELGGGTFNNDSKKLAWNNITIEGGKTDTRRFIVQVSDTIPATPRGANNPAAYDCVMTNAYGNTTNIDVECPAGKAVENTVQQLPETGPAGNMAFGAILLMTTVYFYARSRLMGKEARILRKEFNVGTT